MSYLSKSVTIIITLYSVTWVVPADSYGLKVRQIYLKKQGMIEGTIVHLRNTVKTPVEVYRGIPYAAPPVDNLRFMPPSSSMSWKEVRYMNEFKPVCPQKFPDESLMTSERKRRFNNLKNFLKRESEDCLYLNIYAPYPGVSQHYLPYPVVVFLHGESFEWNSGNPYDGSVLAAHGHVIVVTLNFRLGILGFLQANVSEEPMKNLGLVDQVAALLWIKENIDAFGGDPNKVTLLGHGTGAVFASLLTISPMATHEQNETLFHRAILMSGTALADWALADKSSNVSMQVAQILNCPLDNFSTCLRQKRLDELLEVSPMTLPYETTFGPVIDNSIIPDHPKKYMSQETNTFKRFELMYGVTEMESVDLPIGGDVALIHGMLENERDDELRKYMRARCPRASETCLKQTKTMYNYERDEGREEPNRATLARDELLDILSDARTVAPVILTGLYHSALNIQSYCYVFTHKTHSKKYIRNKTYLGEDLPYVFGVPIENSLSHFEDVAYTEEEKRLSLAIMRYFSSFAHTGNPNVPRPYYSEEDYYEWTQFDKEWLQFDQVDQYYLKLDVPIRNEQHYRREQVDFWNNVFPNISTKSFNNPLPWIRHKVPITVTPNKYENFNKTSPLEDVFGIVRKYPSTGYNPHRYDPIVNGRIVNGPEEVKTEETSTLNLLVIIGVVFLFANIILFTFLYFKCIRKKESASAVIAEVRPDNGSVDEGGNRNFVLSSCNIMKLFHTHGQEKNDSTYDAVNVDAKGSPKVKLARAMSNSTIDAHAKVREWITNEIVLKYSPKNDRKTKKDKNSKKNPPPVQLPINLDPPTRPVSPEQGNARPLLIKTASIDRSNRRKRADKVSVAIDATPSGRGPSVLMQKPIELTKSFEYAKTSPAPLRRSVTMEDFLQHKDVDSPNEVRRSATNINLTVETEPTVIKIEHGHSRSDPVQNVDYNAIKRLKTFDPNFDVNVTCREDNFEVAPPLTPEEALMTIKRRNFPKVLPDHPGRQAFLNKRRSMPAHNIYVPVIEEYSNSEPYSPTGRNFLRFPPVPPPRTTTLGRQGSNPQPVCLSEPMLVEEPPSSPEEEVACNNLYVGPLIPRNNINKIGNSKEKLEDYNKHKPLPKTIVTTNPNNPVQRMDPKVVVKPTIARKKSEDKPGKHIPRVVVPDNRPELHENTQKNATKKSQIPTLVKTSTTSLNRENSSSESNSPSSESSDTGTVVKKV